MTRALFVSSFVALVAANPAFAQRGGFGGNGGFGGMGGGMPQSQLAPEVPGPEVDGPPDSALAVVIMRLSPASTAGYAQLRDSFMVATKVQRDSALELRDRMYTKLDAGDRDGAAILLEHFSKTAKSLKDQMGKFEDRLSKLLTSSEMKDYKKWKKDREEEVAERRERDAGRWRGRGGYARGGRPVDDSSERGGGFGAGGGYDRPIDQKTAIEGPGPKPPLGSTALRIGREVFVTGQVAVDSAGGIVGAGDLAAQSQKAFSNLLAVLASARSGPLDVLRLTIYVVNYDPKDLDTIKAAAASFLASRNPPVVNVLGVQSLSRPGLLISVEATALANLPR